MLSYEIYEKKQICEKLPHVFLGAFKQISLISEYPGYKYFEVKYSFDLKNPLELKITLNACGLNIGLYKRGYNDCVYKTFAYSTEEFEEKTIEMLKKYTKDLLKEKEKIENQTDEIINYFKLSMLK